MDSCIVLSDTHLSPDHGQATGLALGRLLTESPTDEVILAGDIFDLSLEPARASVEDAVGRALAGHPAFRSALAAQVARGGRVTVVPGNHDAPLTNPGGEGALRRAIGAEHPEQLTVSRWFARRGPVHIEHGHLYDADNAFAHPLADHDPRTEPLGTALMRRFVAPNDAFFFAHAHRTTPASGLKTAFEKWGARAPVVIARYFLTAFGLVGDAAIHKGTRRREREQGEARLLGRARELDLEPSVLRQLVTIGTMPTHESFGRTFFRLYFDRIFAVCSLATGLGLLTAAGLGATGPAAGALATAVGGGYLAQSILREKNRYGGNIVEQIGASADLVRQATGAELVVLGHTHVPVQSSGYVNLGSFGYGWPTRPYLALDHAGKPSVRHAAR